MKKILLFCAGWLTFLVASSQSINKAEYFINTDPGIGNGVNLPISSPSSTLTDISFDVNLAALPEGFHHIHLRVRDSEGKWSPTEFRTIYKSSSVITPGSLVDIIAAEYFIDEDPGIGEGTEIAITAGNILEPMSFEVPVDALAVGFHQLYLRVKDEDGNWSSTERRFFQKMIIPSPPPAAPDLVRLEHFVDTDPGFGNATNIPFTAGTSVENQVFILDLSALTEGSHKLYVRAKDGDNRWSLVHVENIVVCNFPAPILSAASNTTTSSFSLSWSAVPNATGYRLDISNDNFQTFLTGFNNKSVTTTSQLVNTSLTSGSSYQIRVRTVGTCVSTNSNVITATTLLNTPNPTVSNITDVSFQLTWAPVTSANGYEIELSSNNFETFVIDEVTGTSTIIADLQPNATYQYRMRAVNDVATSANSISQTITTLPTTSKSNQTISFTAIGAKTLGDTPFTLSATSSSGLPVSYLGTSGKVSIAGGTVTLLTAGSTTITAVQEGNALFHAAPEVTQSFCINPRKPVITISDEHTSNPKLHSSNTEGNQWYYNDAVLSAATGQSITVAEDGGYTVRTTIEGCQSALSDSFAIVITGLRETTSGIYVFPSPARDDIYVTGLPQETYLVIFDLLGRKVSAEVEVADDVHRVNVRALTPNAYILVAESAKGVYKFTFRKE